MPTSSYDYALIRLMPRVDRGEFINVGVVLFCRTRRFLNALVEIDAERLRAIGPELDIDEVRKHLESIPRLCAGAGPIGEKGQADSFHWLVAPHSTIIQASPVHCGTCEEPAVALEHLMDTMVRVKGKMKG
jgi:hypothetical protein